MRLRPAEMVLCMCLVNSCLAAPAQSIGAAIPATAPTQSVSDLPSARVAASASRVGSDAVQWNGSTLAIHASGEDLPGILTQVAQQTGLRVTGGVPDERVFGVYGPGPLQQVVADLFNGLSVNLLLVNDTPTQPKELILTPRTGGPTPPSPARTIEAYDQRPNRNDRPYRGTPPPGVAGFPQPTQNGVPPAPIAPAAIAPADATSNVNTSTDAGAQPQSPNGVKTPEQIFEELRKRQQLQQGTTPAQQ